MAWPAGSLGVGLSITDPNRQVSSSQSIPNRGEQFGRPHGEEFGECGLGGMEKIQWWGQKASPG